MTKKRKTNQANKASAISHQGLHNDINERETIYSYPNYGNIYSALVQTRNTELTIYWTRYNILGAIVFVLVAAALNTKSDTLCILYWDMLCWVGFILAWIWLFVAFTGRGIVIDWQNRVADIESDPNKWKAFTSWARSPRVPFYEKLLNHLIIPSFKQPYTYVALLLPLAAIIIWSLLLYKPYNHSQDMHIQQQINEINKRIAVIEGHNANHLKKTETGSQMEHKGKHMGRVSKLSK